VSNSYLKLLRDIMQTGETCDLVERQRLLDKLQDVGVDLSLIAMMEQKHPFAILRERIEQITGEPEPYPPKVQAMFDRWDRVSEGKSPTHDASRRLQ